MKPQTIRNSKTARFDVTAPSGEVMKFHTSRVEKGPDETVVFLALLRNADEAKGEKTFSYVGRIHPWKGDLLMDQRSDWPEDTAVVQVARRALLYIYGRATLPKGFSVAEHIKTPKDTEPT